MDEDWEDELTRAAEELEAELNMGIPQPTFRAAVSEGQIRLVGSALNLGEADEPLGTMFDEVERAGVTIADLSDSGDADSDAGLELTVTLLAEGDPEAEEALVEWAALIGYRHVWFPDRVVVVDPGPPFGRKARGRCPSCRHEWTGRGRKFWLTVRQRRAFPVICPLCGADLPQWQLDRPESYITDCPHHYPVRRDHGGD
jgi:hypothetical protein